MQLEDIKRLQSLMRRQDWTSAYALLDQVRDGAATREDIASEAHWRAAALGREQRFAEAIELLREKARFFGSQCLVNHNIANCLSKLGRDEEAVQELKKAPIEEEMGSFYGLAIDAKFFLFYLLAKNGDASVEERLSEIPDDYRHIAMGGKRLTKADIIALLK
jgi:tetratricopeptide (TPR) repeat protein